MKTIYKGNNFVIQWSIMDAVTSLPFDFNDMFVEFIVYSDNYKGRISGCKITGNKMQAEIMANTLPVGVYDIVCSYKNSMNSGHCICRRAFNITRNPDFCSNTDSIVIESYASPLKLENMDINYLGHFPSEGDLPDSDKPAWALVGTLKFARPWFFYTANVVPPGFQTGWNDLSEVLGTYDLTADKVSIFDFNLVTEYNVSRNHPNIKRDFSNDWGMAKFYYPEYDKYKPCKVYNEGEHVNMPDYTENTFIALRETFQPPFITIEVSSEFTLGEAVAITPEQYRYPGIRLTFVNNKTHQAETWFWLGGEWENEDKWIKPVSDVTINNLPDEEDISTTKDSTPRLQLKDKLHDKNSYSGLGRCYLRKNMVDGVNVLTQDMFTNADGSSKKNTRYIIQYDYDLNGATIEVPEGCVLDFEGGSVSNGVISGVNYSIFADKNVAIFNNTTLCNIPKVYAAWFGVSPDNDDNSPYIAKALENPSLNYAGNRTVIFGSGVFKIKQSVNVSSANIVGVTPIQKLNGNKESEYKTIFRLEGDTSLFTVFKTNDMLYQHAVTYIENCLLKCPSKSSYPNSIGIDTNTTSLKMRNCELHGFTIGLNARGLISSEFDKVDFAYNTKAIYFNRKDSMISTSTWFRRCYIYENNIHFKNEANSILDCHFNACIFESAKTKSMEINPYGFVVLHLTDCYSENNRTEDYETSKYDIEILPVTLTDVMYFKLLSVGNIWGGQNFGLDKWGTFIKVNAGTFYSYGDTYTRYNYAMEIDDTTAAKINVDFNSHIFSGPIAALDEENSKISIARTNLYIHTVAGDGREVQTSVPQVNLQLRDGAYPKIGISAERDVALQRKGLCLKSETAGTVRVYDNHLLAIGPKKRIGNVDKAISVPVNESQLNILAADPSQAFIRVNKSADRGDKVLILSTSDDDETDMTNLWDNWTIPILAVGNGIPETALKDSLLYFDRKNGGLYSYSHYYAKVMNVADGYPPVLRKGTFDEKPEPSVLLDGMDYYCTDKKKKILCNGTEWVNMDGTKLD